MMVVVSSLLSQSSKIEEQDFFPKIEEMLTEFQDSIGEE